VLSSPEDGFDDGGVEGRGVLLGLDDQQLRTALHVDEILDVEVVPTSSPGVPWVRLGKCNRDIIQGPNRETLVSALLARIRLHLGTELHYVEGLTASELVQQGFSDPVKTFIKNEPHTLKKLRAGKLRLISNVSLVDSLVERILFRLQNRCEIRHWKDISSKPGMGLHDEGLKELWSTFSSAQSKYGSLAETDVSGWDWSVKYWLMQDDMLCRAKLAGARKGSAYYHLLMMRSLTVSLKVFCLSSGKLVAQKKRGLQASGSYNTSAGNSRMRVLLAYCALVLWIMVMGDDGVETSDPTSNTRALYELMGFPIKDYVICEPGEFSFCSTNFVGSWKGSPANAMKTVFRYLSHSLSSRTVNAEFRVQLEDDLRHHPDRERILSRVDFISAMELNDSITELESKQC
jgi:hypothetical protein